MTAKYFSLGALLTLFLSNAIAQSSSTIYPNLEIKTERGMYSKVYLKADGDKEAIFSTTPVHFLKNGVWEEISNKITTYNEGYQNENNVIQSYFPNNISSSNKIKLVVNAVDEISIFSEKKLVTYNDQNKLNILDVNSENLSANIIDNKIIYPNIYKGISDEYSISNGEVKNNVVLSAAPILLNKLTSGYFGFQEILELPMGWKITALDKTANTLTSSALIIFDAKGDHVLSIPAPVIFDNNGLESDGANPVEGKYLVKHENNQWSITTLVPVDWLKDENTKYPISIDPTVVLAGVTGGWQSPNNFVDNSGFVFIGVCCGNLTHRAWIKFNTASIPDNSCVTNVELQVYENNSSGGAELVHAYDVTGAPGPYGAITPAAYTDFGTGWYTSFTLGAVGTYGYFDLGINADALLQAQLPGDWFQVALIFDNEPSTNYKVITATASNLRVTYSSCCPPPPAIAAITGPTSICQGSTATYTVPAQVGALSYNWTVPAGATITSGQNTTTLNVTWNSTPGGQVCIDWTDCGGTSPQTCLNVTVNPPPTVTVPSSATYCPGATVPASAYVSNPAGGTYTWTNTNPAIGLAASGTGNTPAFTATNATGAAISGTITVTPTVGGCLGAPSSYTITVNPTPTVSVPSNTTYCNGAAVPAFGFTSVPAGATYTWSNTNPAIGLAASGTGNTPGFTATNSTGTAISGTITVTPTVSGCVGTPSSYTITVNPTPAAPTALSVTICPNNSVTLTATAPGGTYEWYDAPVAGTLLTTGASYTTPILTVNTTYYVQTTVNGCVSPMTAVTVTIAPALVIDAGLDATICSGNSYLLSVTPNGVGYSYVWDEPLNLAFSTIYNPSVSPTATTTYTVTVTDPNNCVGTDDVIITVNPTPTVTVPSSATYCNGDAVPAGVFTSTPAGGTFTWTNTDPSIGLAASGTGNTPAFTATNISGSPVTATITVTPTVSGCVGSSSSYTITVNPTPAAPTALSVTICPNNSVTLTATAPGGTYEWYDAPVAGTLLVTNASYTTPVLAANTTYYVQTTVNGCVSPMTAVTVTIAPALVVDAGLDDTICLGSSYPLSVTPNGVGYNYVWDEPANPGFSNIYNPSVSPTATTTYTVTVTDPNNCVGTDDVTITVNPTPTVTVPANATYCNGDAVPAGVFTSTPAGGTFTWTNTDPSIGLAASGAGNTPGFTATNLTGATIVATITVTPTVSGCVGPSSSYTITINPTPTVTVPSNATYCNGDAVPLGIFTGTPSGGTFTWTNTDPTIGLGASGTGDAPAFTAANLTGSSVTATITVTPTANGCIGPSASYTITVNPTPTVTVPANAAYCNADAVPQGVFTSTPAGGTFAWTNSNATIGLGASGVGNTPAFTAINTTGAPITSTITVTPTVNGCVGPTSSYTITVNPGASTNAINNIQVCPGDLVPAGAFTSVPSGGTFTWTNTNTSIGLTASGVGNTPAFTANNSSSSPVVATISVTGTANGCPGGPTSYTITVNPVVSATTNVSVCQGDSMLINGVYYSTAGSYPDTLVSSYGCDSIVTYNLTINIVTISTSNVVICEGDSVLLNGNYYSSAGSYPFTFTSSLGCDSVIIYSVTVSPLPSYTVTGGTSINIGESSNLAVIPGVYGTTYSWDPPTGLSCLFCQNPIASPMTSTWYYVTVTNAAGCQQIDSVYIEVDPSTNIYIPNIFSPNEDGNNDVYMVRGKGVDQFNLAIYNRWGQLVFESKDIERGWDGTKDGTPLNQGVFVYKLNVIMYDGDRYEETGNITLIR